jgi:predicted dehydrogenase
MTLRVALLGCGRIAGLVHGPLLGAMPDVAVTVLADAVPENRGRLAAHAPGAVHAADWRLALDLGLCDAAVICLPPALHAGAAIAALDRGLHVYVEKPLALNVAEAGEMIAARDRAGRVGMVGLNFRFHPLVADARRRIASGELGPLVAIRALFSSPRRVLPDWKSVPGAGGDALWDLATHDLDLVAYLAGAPWDAASLAATHQDTGSGSAALVHGRLADSTLVQLAATQTTGAAARRYEVLGQKGHLTIDLADARPRRLSRGTPARLPRLAARARALSPAEILHHPGHEPSFELALRAFVCAALGARSRQPSFEDGLAAMQLVLAAEAVSGRGGRLP